MTQLNTKIDPIIYWKKNSIKLLIVLEIMILNYASKIEVLEETSCIGISSVLLIF